LDFNVSPINQFDLQGDDMNPEVPIDRLVLAIRHPEVEVIDALGVAVVEVNDLALVDVTLAELVPRVGDVLGGHETSVGGHVHDVVDYLGGRSVGVLGEELFGGNGFRLLLYDGHAWRVCQQSGI